MRALSFTAALGLLAFQIATNTSFTSQASDLPQASDPAITAKWAIGEVKAIDPAAKHMTIRTDAGSSVTVAYTDGTTYRRLPPGEQTLTKATDITFAEVSEGDRIWARGSVAQDRKSVAATMIIVMTKGDLAKRDATEKSEWRRRGILGVITALKPATKEITISTRNMAGTQSVIIPISDQTEIHRYAPDSIKFSDAKPSDFAELKVGDQLRALGDRSEDGLRFSAQKVVTGSFRTIVGTVTAVEAETSEIKIHDSEKKQPFTIVIKSDSVLRKFPPASEMGGFGRGPGGGGPSGQAPQSGAQSQPAARPQGAGGPGGPRGGGFNINDMLDRLPTIALADVKVGDTIIVSSTQGVDPTRLTAITLVSGAETLLAMLAPRPQPGQAVPNPAAGIGSGISFGIGLP
jgi:hypothetical protein